MCSTAGRGPCWSSPTTAICSSACVTARSRSSAASSASSASGGSGGSRAASSPAASTGPSAAELRDAKKDLNRIDRLLTKLSAQEDKIHLELEWLSVAEIIG